jgi:hypothetical protein
MAHSEAQIDGFLIIGKGMGRKSADCEEWVKVSLSVLKCTCKHFMVIVWLLAEI